MSTYHPPSRKRWADCTLLILVGLALLTTGWLWPLYQRARLAEWEEARCSIVECTIVPAGPWAWLQRKLTSPEERTLRVRVKFAYQYRGSAYQSEQGDFHLPYELRQEVQAMARSFPRGALRACWVNPELPAQAVLLRERPLNHLSGIAGLVLLIVGMVYLGIAPTPSETRYDLPPLTPL